MVKNFISVSGVSDRCQLGSIGKIYQEEKLSFPLTIGYQVSSMSINQGTQNPRQPAFKELEDLCRETLDNGFIPALHYYTKDNKTILKDMEKIVKAVIAPSFSLVQFNTLPQPIELLRKVKETGFGIIFKVAVSDKQSSQGGYKVWKGESVQDANTGEVSPLLDQVALRADFLDYAMFDPSHGTNLGLNLAEESLAIRFGKGLVERRDLDHLGLIYAGGIKPANVREVTKSLKSFFSGRFSVDTESGVRIENKLDLGLVKDYLVNSQFAI